MLGQKVSNGKMRGIELARVGNSILEWNFRSWEAEVGDVELKTIARGAEDCLWLVGGLMRILHGICNFIFSIVFLSLGLGVYQMWFSSCVVGWTELRRWFVKS